MSTPGGGFSLRHANVIILTDETEFARLLTAGWQTERQVPRVTVLTSDLWQERGAPARDLVVVGPVREGGLTSVLRALDPSTAVILFVSKNFKEIGQFKA